MKYTKNLRTAGQGNGKQELPILRADGKEVGCVRGEGHLGDAYLFSGAADLLAACEVALEHLDKVAQSKRKWTTEDQTNFERLEAAVAKAKGQRRS